MKPRRYQLAKDAVAVIYRGHPWIFRDHLSTAAQVFHDGDWLRLVDGKNEVVGYGIYDAEGALAIRVVRRGAERPSAKWLRGVLATAVNKRAALLKETTAVRLVHGESDGLPGVVADKFGDTLVVQSYTRGADALARFAATAIANELSIPNVMLKPALRRKSEEPAARVLRGKPPGVATIKEGALTFAVDLAEGQKSGTYLDLRGLRRALATSFVKVTELAPVVVAAPKPVKGTPTEGADGATGRKPKAPVRATLSTPHSLAGARVLNLFAYSGMLGRAAEQAGATSITHVDTSERALAFAAAHHAGDPTHHTYVTADIFQWLPALAADEMFDVVIVDPPAMTSNKQQVPAVLAGYKKLYRAAAPHVKSDGLLVVACCTSRVERERFRATAKEILGDQFEKVLDLAPEADHPVAFPQTDYLKIEVWRRR